MKTGTLCTILLFCVLLACTVPAVNAAEVQDVQQEPVDEAVQLYNRADKALAMNTSQFVSSGARTYALVDKSKAQIELGDYDGALVTIEQALTLEETDKLWNNRGYVLYKLGRYQESVNSYNVAIRITPEYTVALINRGDALMKLAKYQDALDSYYSAFRSDLNVDALTISQKTETWKNMGDAYVGLGKYQEAIKAYESSLMNDPKNSETAAALSNARQDADSAMLFTAFLVIVILSAGAAGAYLFIRKRSMAPEKKLKK